MSLAMRLLLTAIIIFSFASNASAKTRARVISAPSIEINFEVLDQLRASLTRIEEVASDELQAIEPAQKEVAKQEVVKVEVKEKPAPAKQEVAQKIERKTKEAKVEEPENILRAPKKQELAEVEVPVVEVAQEAPMVKEVAQDSGEGFFSSIVSIFSSSEKPTEPKPQLEEVAQIQEEKAEPVKQEVVEIEPQPEPEPKKELSADAQKIEKRFSEFNKAHLKRRKAITRKVEFDDLDAGQNLDITRMKKKQLTHS